MYKWWKSERTISHSGLIDAVMHHSKKPVYWRPYFSDVPFKYFLMSVLLLCLQLHTDYEHTIAKSLILSTQIQIPTDFGYKGLFFGRNNDWLIENMDKGLTVPKWMLKNQPKKTPKCPKIYHPSPKVWDFNEKRLHWASVVRVTYENEVS